MNKQDSRKDGITMNNNAFQNMFNRIVKLDIESERISGDIDRDRDNLPALEKDMQKAHDHLMTMLGALEMVKVMPEYPEYKGLFNNYEYYARQVHHKANEALYFASHAAC